MRIAYLSTTQYPSRFANRLQVLKMAEAFSKEHSCTLFVSGLFISREELFSSYGITHPFSVEVVHTPFLPLPKSIRLALAYRKRIHDMPQDSVFYVRDVLLAFFLTWFSQRFRERFYFENHSLGKFPQYVYRRVWRYARGIVTTNEQKKHDLRRQYGIAENRIRVLGNGVDIEEFQALPSKEKARQVLGIAGTKPLIIYTGSVGEAYGTGVIETVKDSIGDAADIRIISGLPRKEALLYIAAADVVLAPYLDAGEHFRWYMSPMKIKEYMAAGKPIIASDLPAVREILSEDRAFLVPPGDAVVLADAIREIMAHTEEAERRGERAKEYAVTHFDWQKRANAIAAFMEECIKNEVEK